MMGIRSCSVSFEDGTGIRHTVTVAAESVFEAAALGLRMFADGGSPPGPGATLEIAAQSPVVSHAVSVQRVRNWLQASGKTPKEQALKSRLREVVG
jgi:hypothetical protein